MLRGEIRLVDFDPSVGSEANKRRPALIVSNDHYQTVGYLERGEYAPSLHLALRIARYFDVPVESVFSLEEFPRLT